MLLQCGGAAAAAAACMRSVILRAAGLSQLVVGLLAVQTARQPDRWWFSCCTAVAAPAGVAVKSNVQGGARADAATAPLPLPLKKEKAQPAWHHMLPASVGGRLASFLYYYSLVPSGLSAPACLLLCAGLWGESHTAACWLACLLCGCGGSTLQMCVSSLTPAAEGCQSYC